MTFFLLLVDCIIDCDFPQETITSVAGALKQMQTVRSFISSPRVGMLNQRNHNQGISSVIELVEEKKTLDRMLFYAKTERSEQQKRHQKDMDYHLAMWDQKSLDLEVKEKEIYRKLARGKEELQSSRQTLSQKDKELEQLRNDLDSARTDMAKYLKRVSEGPCFLFNFLIFLMIVTWNSSIMSPRRNVKD